MVIHAVDKHDPQRMAGEGPSGVQPTEAAADHEDGRIRHPCSIPAAQVVMARDRAQRSAALPLTSVRPVPSGR